MMQLHDATELPRQTRHHDENQFRWNVHDTSVNSTSTKGYVPM